MKTGFIAGTFDILHPGYIYTFKRCKHYCDYLYVALQDDPNVYRQKISPILSLHERQFALKSIKFIDEIVVYKTENDLIEVLDHIRPNIRFLGDDYIDRKKEITTGKHVSSIVYIERDHGWSTTRLKYDIYNQIKEIKDAKQSQIEIIENHGMEF